MWRYYVLLAAFVVFWVFVLKPESNEPSSRVGDSHLEAAAEVHGYGIPSSGKSVLRSAFFVPTPTISVPPAPAVVTTGDTPPALEEPVPYESPISTGENIEVSPVSPLGQGYPDEMVAALCGQGFEWDCGTALRICWLEMGQKYQPWAVNQTPIYHNGVENHATGLCQLLMPLHAGWFNYEGGNPLDPYQNAAATYGLWKTSGGTFCYHWFYWC